MEIVSEFVFSANVSTELGRFDEYDWCGIKKSFVNYLILRNRYLYPYPGTAKKILLELIGKTVRHDDLTIFHFFSGIGIKTNKPIHTLEQYTFVRIYVK